MKVGLIQLDGKLPNLALMKLSSWHKNQGDDVTILDVSSHPFDRIYASKVFVGGSGYDLHSELPPEIELEFPDYAGFKTDYSIGFTSRGCLRDCGFCIVKEKEGSLHDVSTDWMIGQKILLLDNNFLASPTWKEKLEFFINKNCMVTFNQGLDIRLINEENAKLLVQVKYYDLKFKKRRLYFAFDDPSLEQTVKEKIAILNAAGIPSRHLMFYVLVGYNTTIEDDLNRINLLIRENVLPYVMRFNHNRKDRELNALARWVNGRYYKVCKWEEYTRKKIQEFPK